MAIEERELPASNQWEVKATGEDIPKLAGMLTSVGNEAYRKAFHKNEGQYVRVTDPHGNPTQVHQRDLDTALAQGYGQAAASPRAMIDGFGAMKRDGVIRFRSGKGWRETWYADGRHVREES